MQFTGQLYPFQEDVLKWTAKNDRGIIGLDMGLGKTVITIAVICQKQYTRTLIVVPLPIIEQWKKALLEFSTLKNKSVCLYQGASRKSKSLVDYKIVLTTYETVRIDMVNKSSPLFLAVNADFFDCLVLDEAHKIRNKKTNTNTTCTEMGVHISSKWLLTGTTIHNKFEDFYNLCVFIKIPELSMENLVQKEFRDRWYFRLTKLQCNLQLPEKSIHEHALAFDETHLAEYTDLYNETKEVYEDYLARNSRSVIASLLTKILRLRQCCNHPDAILDAEKYKQSQNRHDYLCSAKFLKSLEIIKQIPVGDKVIVFSQWEHTLNVFRSHLDRNGIKYLQYNGSLDTKERSQVLNAFRNSATQVLLITIQSGGVGLDLNFANHVILMDSWWNHALEEQAIDRVYRIGQKKKVEVHRLYMMDTIEEWMLNMKDEKQTIDTMFHEDSQIYHIDKSLLAKVLHQYI